MQQHRLRLDPARLERDHPGFPQSEPEDRAMATKRKRSAAPAKQSPAKASAKSSVAGSRRGTAAARGGDLNAAKLATTDEISAAMPFNPNKPAEHGELALDPPEGAHVPP